MRAILVAALLLTACYKDPVSSSSTNNPSVTVALLFEHEGCRVYRFSDAGRAHYYVKCSNSCAVREGRYTDDDGRGNGHVEYADVPTGNAK